MDLFGGPIGRDGYALIRFGYGWPARGAPVAAEAMLERLGGPDRTAQAVPKRAFDAAVQLGLAFVEVRKQARAAGTEAARRRHKEMARTIRDSVGEALLADLARIVVTDDPFRERLAHFWANHFAIRTAGLVVRAAQFSYAEAAIRPHLSGRFADLLRAAVLNPMMLTFLDQSASIGPNSVAGMRRGGGLNENLAREILELHTLGVGAPYSQADVTEFAELLTGLRFNPSRHSETQFLPQAAEPGAETVLGIAYGGDPARIGHIHRALEDLAVHPATAAHLSRKIAAHFVADVPDPGLVEAMARAWRDSGGDLRHVYWAMLAHPAAWSGFGAKVKSPMEFVGSALRALEVPAGDLVGMTPGEGRSVFGRSLADMGQPFGHPPGPDGFPDDAESWLQPFGLAHRIGWAMRAAKRWGRGRAPADFARAALGAAAGPRLTRAVAAAETRAQGIGVVLASAEFNRR